MFVTYRHFQLLYIAYCLIGVSFSSTMSHWPKFSLLNLHNIRNTAKLRLFQSSFLYFFESHVYGFAVSAAAGWRRPIISEGNYGSFKCGSRHTKTESFETWRSNTTDTNRVLVALQDTGNTARDSTTLYRGSSNTIITPATLQVNQWHYMRSSNTNMTPEKLQGHR